MAFNDAFGFFGHYSFSSKPTHGRTIYESMSDSLGKSYNQDFNGLQSARLYADAVCLASAQYQIDRAANNRDVSKATELLVQLEKDYQVTPGPDDTLKQRRDFLSALVQVSKGNSKQVIESALFTLLGSDFISYEHLEPNTFPDQPGNVGVFSEPAETPKQFFIVPYISQTNVPITVEISIVENSEAPIAGETYTVDPDPRSTIEKITIQAVSGSSITATFTRSHEARTIATRPYPLWSSYARYSNIVLTVAAAGDAEKRRKVNELMAKATRGVSQWDIVSSIGFQLDSSSTGILNRVGLS